MRSTSNAKTVDAARKPSPGDGGSRRSNSQKAWGSSSLSQRGPAATQQNGSTLQPKNAGGTRPAAPKDAGLSDKCAHERLTYVLGGAIGLTVHVTTKSGDTFSGLLSGSVLGATSSKLTLKMVRKLSAPAAGAVNGVAPREAALVGSSPEHAMNFDMGDVADMAIPEFALPQSAKLANGSSAGFRTDADISGNLLRGERPLQRWVPEEADTTDLSLESGSTATWDQFEANSRLFNTQSTYDENIYTTTINRDAASYKANEARAEKIAREIEGSVTTNAHLREERGHAPENDGVDEEDKYSGVRRKDATKPPPLAVGAADKYTPPARRAPTATATVPGAPVDPAIISAQLSRPEPARPAAAKPKPEHVAPPLGPDESAHDDKSLTTAATPPAADEPAGPAAAAPAAQTPESTPTIVAPGPTENVEVKVLNQFRQFADLEKQRVIERRKAQQSQDRNAKLNELLRFSKSFKLKTPIPTDLIGILAKDPAKQEAIVEKAQKEHNESASGAPSAASSTPPSVAPGAAAEAPPPPSVPEKPVFNRGRGGLAQAGRSDRPHNPQQAPPFPARGNNAPYPGRFPPDRKGGAPTHAIPAPIPLVETRAPPTGPMAETSGVTSPQRHAVQTPSTGSSGKFNLNVKAFEFRPAAAAFNPSGLSQTPTSPSSSQRAGSVSRTATPAALLGNRKPKPAADRPSLTAAFNPITRLKDEFAPKPKGASPKPDEAYKDYRANGGIPNAFHTGPRWTVAEENDQKTYEEAFDQFTGLVLSPAQNRSGLNPHLPYPGPGLAVPSGPANLPHLASPQHGPPANHHQFGNHYDDSGRMPFGTAPTTPQVFPSPSLASRQASAFASPMAHAAQLSYQQPPYFGASAGQMPMPMRPFPGTPSMMHAQIGQMAAPMMVQQASNGPYMGVPQQFNPQLPMYSPNPGHVYPHQNGGFSSPGRVAPMMMPQGSQQGHATAPGMMFNMSNQGAPMAFPPPQQAGMARASYGGGQPYGATPHQGFAMQQRTMSSGYAGPGKVHAPMPGNHGPGMNGPPPPGPGFGHVNMDGGADDGK